MRFVLAPSVARGGRWRDDDDDARDDDDDDDDPWPALVVP